MSSKYNKCCQWGPDGDKLRSPEVWFWCLTGSSNLPFMFLYDQAQQACKEHHYLIGSQISKGWRIMGVIENIVIVPLDGINQYRFLKEYKQTKNAEQSLKFYTGELYNVLLIGKSYLNPTDMITIPLEKYLSEHQTTTHHQLVA
jgi:hypothetical protein